MKIVSLLIISVLAFFVLNGFYSAAINETIPQCPSGSFSVWPASGEIPILPNFVFSMSGNGKKVSEEILLGKEVFLKSGEEKIKLILKEKFVPHIDFIQMVFIPETKLRENAMYSLDLGQIVTPEFSMALGLPELQENKIPAWRVVKTDSLLPAWKSKPMLSSMERIEGECGPSISILFNCDLPQNHNCAVLVETVDILTQAQTAFLLFPSSEGFSVGREISGGPFEPVFMNWYKLRFRLMNSSGIFESEYTNWTEFEGP